MHGIEDTDYMPWCSTKVDGNGKHNQGNWGDCGSECLIDNTCKCIFPFHFKGKTYKACTMDETPMKGMPWCSAKVDDQGNH